MPTTETPRGKSARALLQIRWDHPVYKEVETKSEATTVKLRQALPRDQALAYVAGDDPRPLLVLRECRWCNKTDNALLRPGSKDNEKTIVYSQWFHCVKLPLDVIESDHPFNALFENNDAPHFFVATRDGQLALPLETATSRTELWSSMSKVLAEAYVKDPTPSYRDYVRQIDRLDVLDDRVADLERQRGRLLERAGKLNDSKLRKIDRELESTQKEIAEAHEAIEKALKAEVKPPPQPAAPAPAGE